MPNWLFSKKLATLVILYGGLLIFLISTDPNKLPIGLLILPIVWLFLCLFLSVRYLLEKLSGTRAGLSGSKQFILAFLIAALPSSLLLLKSIDQLTLRDGLLLPILIGFSLFYVSRLSLGKRR